VLKVITLRTFRYEKRHFGMPTPENLQLPNINPIPKMPAKPLRNGKLRNGNHRQKVAEGKATSPRSALI
jgi:hypothetical protein